MALPDNTLSEQAKESVQFLHFSKEDLTAILPEFPNDTPEQVADKMVRYLRHLEEESPGEGVAQISILLNTQRIGIVMGIRLKEAMQDTKRPYKIIIV